MHGFDFSIPFFHTHVRGKLIAIVPQLVVDVLHVSRVEFPDYPSCEHPRTVSKGELKSAFCECPFDWGKCQFTYCSDFAKVLNFLTWL